MQSIICIFPEADGGPVPAVDPEGGHLRVSFLSAFYMVFLEGEPRCILRAVEK